MTPWDNKSQQELPCTCIRFSAKPKRINQLLKEKGTLKRLLELKRTLFSHKEMLKDNATRSVTE